MRMHSCSIMAVLAPQLGLDLKLITKVVSKKNRDKCNRPLTESMAVVTHQQNKDESSCKELSKWEKEAALPSGRTIMST